MNEVPEPMAEDEFERARLAFAEGSDERSKAGRSIFDPLGTLQRADIEAKLAANDATLCGFAARGVALPMAELLANYVALAVERLFGDMDNQARLELENAYADLVASRLAATQTAVNQQMLMNKSIGSNGLILP